MSGLSINEEPEACILVRSETKQRRYEKRLKRQRRQEIRNDFKEKISAWLPRKSKMLFFAGIILSMFLVYHGSLNTARVYVDGQFVKEVRTVSRTPEDLLDELNMETHPRDRIVPGGRDLLCRNEHVYIEKAFPVILCADSEVAEFWTSPVSVGDFLVAEGIEIGEFDEVDPGLNEILGPYDEISIVRIEKIYTSAETAIPFNSVYRENPAMDMGSVCVVCEGEEGLKKETMEIVLADGREVSRAVIDETIISPPRNKIIERGTRAVVPGLDIQFVKMLNVNATAYCPGTPGSGCPVDSRGYSVCTGKATGRTATGAVARGGDGTKQNPYIIAVDPKVIPLYSNVYIEGYGYAVALDTGGAIKGNKIDILFSTHSSALRFGRRNLKVYLLP